MSVGDPVGQGVPQESRDDASGWRRPSLHYAPARNWMNDPNGLVHHDGVYHLFYQHNPVGEGWGNMSWGHATSTDLFDWTEQPVAIGQTFDEWGRNVEDVFSGSVVVDHDNTSGFGSLDAPPLVAVYTSAYTLFHPDRAGLQAQSIAYSNDNGSTWTTYAGNPVVDRGSTEFRDPKVFRYHGDGPGEQWWVMVAVEAVDRQVVLYRSENLLDWEHVSTFGPAGAVGGVWECPDLFELPVDEDPRTTRWVLVVSVNPGGAAGGGGVQYFVGDFDGTTFVSQPTTGPRWLDWGRDHYAAVSFNDVADGRRIMIAWMCDWAYAADLPITPWCSHMSLPREVSLTDLAGRIELRQQIVTEIDRHAEPPLAVSSRSTGMPGDGIEPGTHLVGDGYDVFRLHVELGIGDAERAGVVVRASEGFSAEPANAAAGTEGTLIGYDVTRGEVFVDRTRSGAVDFHPDFAGVSAAPVPTDGGVIRLEIYLDRTSVEVIAAGGTRTISSLIFPDPSSLGLGVFALGGAARLRRLDVVPLRGGP